MRIFKIIIGAISASRLTMDGIYPVYPMDLLRDHGHMKHHIGQPKLKTNNPMFNQLVEENQLWKSKIKFSNRKGFINGLINTPATLAINSDTLQIIDHSEFCWVIVAYKSESAPIKATKSLISTMAQAFYERCGVGLLDLDYPVNKNLFGDFVTDTPSIIFKNPYKPDAMRDLDYQSEKGTKYSHELKLRPIEEWGEVITTEKLTTNVFLVIRNIMKTYESKVGRNLKIRSIYMPHYENKFKHWMSGAIKRIDHAMRDEAREFADLSRECPKKAKSDPKDPKKNQNEGNDSTECTEDELKLENEMATEIYKIKLAELKDETDGWDLRDVLEKYIQAAPHLHTKMSWNKIKDNEIHLDPSTLPDLSIPAFDWLREYHRDEL